MNNHTKRRGIAVTVFLVGVNILAWIWAICVFHHNDGMLSAACRLYTSDAAAQLDGVDVWGRSSNKKNKRIVVQAEVVNRRRHS